MTAPTPFDPSWLSAGDPDAVSAARAAGPRAEALVAEWVRVGNAAAVQAVAEAGEGAARKAARRGLNVLKSRGVAPPPRVRVARLTTGAGTGELRAAMVSADGDGVTWLLFDQPGVRGHEVALIALGPSGLLLRVEPALVTAQKLKEHLSRRFPPRIEPVPVPLAWARHRVAQARRLHAERGAPEPLGLTTSAPLLQPAPTEPPPHPFDEEGLVLSEEDARITVAGSAALHQLPEFLGWVPHLEAVREVLRATGAAIPPGSTVSNELLEAEIQRQILAATDRYFSAERRERLVHELKDAAIAVLARHGEERALDVAALIELLPRCGLITDPPSEIPFLVGYFRKALGVLAARQGGKLDIPLPPGVQAAGAGTAPDQPAEAATAAPAPEGAPSAEGATVTAPG